MKIKKILIVSSLLVSLICPAAAIAATTPANTNTAADSVSCDELNQSVSNILTKDVVGSLYIKLPKSSSVDSSELSVYQSSPMIGAQCNLIKDVKVDKNTWVKLGDGLNIPSGTSITINGNGLDAEIYAASAYLLSVKDNACTPNITCDFKDSFGTGHLDPYLTTTDHDQIAIYEADPVTNLKPYQYSYFDNGIALYVSKTLNQFNRNYLKGGDHVIDIEARYSNFENVHYVSNINMGPDWSKWLLIRSTFYRQKTPGKIIALFILSVLLGLFGIGFYHFVIKKIRDRHAHGIDNYQPPEAPPEDPTGGIVVG